MVIVAGLLISVSAMARDGYAVRYQTSYSNWDSTFGSHYSYSERTTTTTTTTTYERHCGAYRTCYEGYSSTTQVYVEEAVVERGDYAGYTRVTVYDNRAYKPHHRYATYYTHNGRVVRRQYHRRHSRYRNHYHYHGYHTVNYVVLDEFTAGIVIGMEFINIGAQVLSNCDGDDTACLAWGLASSASGSAISISASLREMERTELQRAIEEREKSLEDSDLEDSLD
tara:strand:+ start:16702 stop:17376 length:675 start_codon:yes stop_codon:yes gene_type:complete